MRWVGNVWRSRNLGRRSNFENNIVTMMLGLFLLAVAGIIVW